MAIVGAVTIAAATAAVLSLASSESLAYDEARSGATAAAEAGSPLPATSHECAVCLSELPAGAGSQPAVRALPACGHAFHADCIGRWLPLRPECPLCRRPVPIADADADALATKPDDWFRSDEGHRTIATVLSWQSPEGSWPKNKDTTAKPYTGKPEKLEGTFDNKATTGELYLLAHAFQATSDATYRDAFLTGYDHILEAQYPNSGWPQVYPLEGGYHDAITYNDDALDNIVSFLGKVAKGQGDYAAVPEAQRMWAVRAQAKALDVVLKSQVRVDGTLTVWGQQHDALTLEPVSARNFEPPALSAAESATLLVWLMTIENPSPDVKAAIRAGVQWLKDHALHDVALVRDASGRHVVPQPGAPLLWARYYDLKTGKPIFGDRDKSIHDDMMEISEERRNGYSWYNTTPQKALDAFARWERDAAGR